VRNRPDREELRARLRSLRTGVVWASGIAFFVVLGLVATNPQGTQAASQAPAQDGSGQQQAAGDSGNPFSSSGSPVTNASANQPPLLHSRRS